MLPLSWFLIGLSLASISNSDRWLEVQLEGTPAGYQHILTEPLDNGLIQTTDEMHLIINRLGTRSEVTTKTVSVENPQGRLVSAREEITQSEQTIVIEAEIHDQEIRTRSGGGTGSYERSIPLAGELCGPAHFARLTAERLRQQGDSVTCRLYQPDSGPSRTTRTLVAETERDGAKALRVMVTTGDRQSGPVWLFDRYGWVIENQRQIAGIEIVSHITDKDSALKAGSSSELSAEVVGRMSPRTNVRLADGRSVERMKIKITQRKPDAGWPRFQGPSQRVLERTALTVTLEIMRPEPRHDSQQPVSHAQQALLQPNRYLQSDDPEIVRLAREISGSEASQFNAIRALQDWVSRNMTFDTGIGLTPASEVVRNRRGTCGAYAVLLASLARAAGIPSRVAMGYLYAAGVWAPHLWTEAFVEGQWLPFDAAGYRPGVADAARFQLDSYTLEDGGAAMNLAAGMMYGNIDVEILEYATGSDSVAITPASPIYRISDSEYRNAGLRVSIKIPSGFAVTKLDAVYPDFTILEARQGSAKVTVSLLEVFPELRTSIALNEIASGVPPRGAQLDGRDAIIVSTAEKARLISRAGESLWMITAEGPHPEELIQQFLGQWRWLPTN